MGKTYHIITTFLVPYEYQYGTRTVSGTKDYSILHIGTAWNLPLEVGIPKFKIML